MDTQENPHLETNNVSGSLVDEKLKDQEKIIIALNRAVSELQKEVNVIKENRILDELGFNPEQLHDSGIEIKPIRHLKRGHGSRPILKSEIEWAKERSVNESDAARKLNISYLTYRKYARLYGIWEPKSSIKGKKNFYNPNRGKYKIEDILLGKFPDYPVYRIKDKLIRSGKKRAECEMCGFNEKRIIDEKLPLILNFLDGNPRNHSIDNMKIYCYNCTFLCGKGYIRRGGHFFDPEFLQDAKKERIFDKSRF